MKKIFFILSFLGIFLLNAEEKVTAEKRLDLLDARVENLTLAKFKFLVGNQWLYFDRHRRKCFEAIGNGDEAEAIKRIIQAEEIFEKTIKDSQLVPQKDGGMKMGIVTLNAEKKQVEFPAKVTIVSEMPIEVILTTDVGRKYEAAFITEARPLHIQTLLTALGAENGARIANYKFPRQGDFIKVEVEWKNLRTGNLERQLIDSFLRDSEKKALTKNPTRWVFVGSEIHDGTFLADFTGDIMINYSIGSGVIDCTQEDLSTGKLQPYSIFPEELKDGDEVKIIFSIHGKGEVLKAEEKSEKSSAEVPTEKSKISAEVPTEKSEKASAEVPTEKSKISAEVPIEKSEKSSAEVPTEKSEKASAEVPTEKSEKASAEVLTEKSEKASAEVPIEKTKEILKK